MRLDIALSGDVQVSRKLLRIGDRAVHARPAFEAIARVLMRIERDQFESEGKRSSGGWAELAPSTIAEKHDSSILFDSGALMASLSEEGDENMTLDATNDYLLFGSKLDYASYHQTGTGDLVGKDEREEGAKGIPRRRPLELKERDRSGLVRILQAFILGDEAAGTAMAAALGV